MTNAPPKTNRTFKSISIGDSLRNVNQKFLYKFGKLDYTIHAKWSEIVGSFFVHYSEPRKIITIKKPTERLDEFIYEKYLHVNVTPSVAVEFQHFQNKIIEKINSYFGYKEIKGIIIHQNFFKKENTASKKNNINLINKKQKENGIKNTTPKINDKDLKESIINLGLSINNEDQ